jgi:ubiquinone/menaquinone biosynthesis C-methylase UbiE
MFENYLRHFMTHVFNHSNHERLESPERRKILPPEKILEITGLQPGQVMVDVGTGTGYFTLPAAHIVGKKGKVLAADISEEMLEIIRSKLTEENKEIIQLIHSDKNNPGIPDSAADYLLLCTVIHESENPRAMLENLYKTIKSGGRLVVVEWIKQHSKMGPPMEHRIAMEDVSGFLKKAGFDSVTEKLFNSDIYILIAQK